MTATKWRNKIKKACQNVGTYLPEYDAVIDTLARMLESRDKVYQQFLSSGANPVITHTNKAGATNLVKNPLLVAWLDINTQSLAYWRDLGLTPKGYRTLSGEKVSKDSEGNPLLDIIQGLAE